MKSSSGAERGFRRATIMAIVVAGAIVATYFLSGPHEDVALEGYEHAEESTTIAGAAELSRQLRLAPISAHHLSTQSSISRPMGC